jgi:EpsD family peptidyl-prolyl cis-trans isomerase
MKSFHLLPLRLVQSLVLTGLLMGISACGNKDGKVAATQVAAKVGSEEISIHQINQVLARTNTAGATPEAVKAMSREVLEKLIDQQLAVEQATENKLHRSPEVVAQIEAAKRDILARAYVQQFTGALPKPTPEEVKKYYVDQPLLFTQRRVFNVQEIVMPATPGATEQLRALAVAGKSMEEIASWLKGQNIQFKGGSATRAAEQIPLNILPQVSAMKDGQTIVLATAQGTTVLHLVASQSSPVAQADALPRIEQYLTNQRANEALTANLKQLRANTTVAYMGEFAKTEGGAAAPAPAVAAPATDANAKTAIEKGVAGLK